MQSQRLLFKPADHNQLQPIQLLSTCNTWYQEKCARPLRTMPRFKRAHAADCARMPVCVHVAMLADPQVIPRVGSSSCLIGCLPVSSHCARDRSRPCGLLTHRSLSLCFSSSLSLSVPRCLPLSPIEPSFEASVGWLWFCLAGRAVGKHFDWRDRTKAHTAIFEAAVLVRKMVSQMIRTWQRNPREDTNARAYGMVYSCDNRSADRNSCGTCNVCRSKQTSLSLASSSICFSIF